MIGTPNERNAKFRNEIMNKRVRIDGGVIGIYRTWTRCVREKWKWQKRGY